jgi:hypothetical protein
MTSPIVLTMQIPYGGITLETAQEQLNLASEALSKALQQQNRSATKALRQDVSFWRQEVARLQRVNRGPTIKYGVAL